MTSKRFPGKVLADLCGQPLIWHVLQACHKIQGKDIVVLAVPDDASSDQLEVVADACKVAVYRGPEDDVLTRYRDAARRVRADYIMRITADCPLLDPEVASYVLELVKEPDVDYASNVMPRTFEQGLDCEAFTKWSLELASSRATEAYDREHCTPWMQRSTVINKINFESDDPERAATNWSVDTEIDLQRVKKVMEKRKCA